MEADQFTVKEVTSRLNGKANSGRGFNWYSATVTFRQSGVQPVASSNTVRKEVKEAEAVRKQ